MRVRLVAALVALAVAGLVVGLVVTLSPSDDSPAPHRSAPSKQPSAADKKVLFVDDFDGGAGTPMDPRKWREQSTCTYNPTASVGRTACGNPAYHDGHGNLAIPATPDAGHAISTAGRFSFTYGTMSARIRLPAQQGYWPAFWALNNRPEPRTQGGDAPLIGEIDAMESFTSTPGLARATFHNWTNTYGGADSDPGNTAGPVLRCTSHADLTQWHTYAARIEPGRIRFYVDGRQCGGDYGPQTNRGKPYAFGPDVTRGLWPILSLQVEHTDDADRRATQPAVMLVDRVEVRAN